MRAVVNMFSPWSLLVITRSVAVNLGLKNIHSVGPKTVRFIYKINDIYISSYAQASDILLSSLDGQPPVEVSIEVMPEGFPVISAYTRVVIVVTVDRATNVIVSVGNTEKFV
jgi:hypothetical protein